MSGALGLALTVSTLYAPAYTVTVDGDTLGVVSDQAVVADAVAQVERRGTEILGHDYQVEGQIGYVSTLSLRSELTQPDQVENYFLEQPQPGSRWPAPLNQVSSQRRGRWAPWRRWEALESCWTS